MNIFRKFYFKYFCRKIIKQNIDYKREQDDDRVVLESIIFPHVLAKYNPKKILDIGREDYQLFYNDFFINRELHTIDIDPEHAEFGNPNQHTIDNATNLKKHYKNNYFDFILMNGVFGWGLDKENDVQKSFNAIYDILKTGGIFILGYNDDIVPLEKIEGLNKLKKLNFKPFKNNKHSCSRGKHFYNFYIK
jgi:SAM-dependent methyltransferase